ncbi:MAG: glycosyltransferase [Planctomycetes bacterium]|nr:glycosyltransferase [Planctomycetota bacterium]
MSDTPFTITHVGTSDTGGGAERIAAALHRGCQALGLDSTLAVGRRETADPSVVEIPNDASRGAWFHTMDGLAKSATRFEDSTPGVWRLRQLAEKLARPAQWLDDARGREHFNYPGTRALPDLTGRYPDLIHCHNLHGSYFDLRELPALSANTPVMLTLHDAWLLSGHCAHSLECERWKTGCGSCPQLHLPPAVKRDATAQNWRTKADIYQRSRLYVATPSRWLMRKVELSMLAPGIVESRVIPHGVDLNIFHPGDQRRAREVVSINPSARVVMFAAANIRGSAWKDYATLRSAVEKLSVTPGERPLVLLAVGESAASERVGNAEIHFVPFTDDPRLMADLYRSADIYAHSAKADTFPTTVLEALACGVPVVASEVGGIPEQVDQGVTGFLIPPGEPDALAERLGWLLRDDVFRRRLSHNAAQHARRRFDFDRTVDDYLAWYAHISQRTLSQQTRSAA